MIDRMTILFSCLKPSWIVISSICFLLLLFTSSRPLNDGVFPLIVIGFRPTVIISPSPGWFLSFTPLSNLNSFLSFILLSFLVYLQSILFRGMRWPFLAPRWWVFRFVCNQYFWTFFWLTLSLITLLLIVNLGMILFHFLFSKSLKRLGLVFRYAFLRRIMSLCLRLLNLKIVLDCIRFALLNILLIIYLLRWRQLLVVLCGLRLDCALGFCLLFTL